jgi:hypothetical protein
MNKKFMLAAAAAFVLLTSAPVFAQGATGAAASAEVVQVQNAPPVPRMSADQRAGAVLQRFGKVCKTPGETCLSAQES